MKYSNMLHVALASMAMLAEQSQQVRGDDPFQRGDVNADQRIDLTDPFTILRYLFADESTPGCLDAADPNDDGEIDVSDAVYDLLYLFAAGNAPRPPFPELGIDPTPDRLDCVSYAVPPAVTAVDPLDAATDVPIYASIAIHFSKAMDQVSVERAISISPTVSFSFSWADAGLTVNVIPGGDLDYEMPYTVTVSSAAEDLGGRSLEPTTSSHSRPCRSRPGTSRGTPTQPAC